MHHIAQIKCFIFSFVCDKLKFVEITFWVIDIGEATFYGTEVFFFMYIHKTLLTALMGVVLGEKIKSIIDKSLVTQL